MKSKPSLMFYCQHSLGMGHLIRALNLIAGLATEFDLCFLNGGPLPEGIVLPSNIELVNLPALGMAADSALISRSEDMTVAEARSLRKALVLDVLTRRQPEVLLLELFPFGRKKFAFELLPLLKAAHRLPNRPRVYCSLRDIMVGGRKDQLRHDNRAAWLSNRYFDGVLVHADPAFVRIDETFKPDIALRVPLIYTGFVGPAAQPVSRLEQRERRVVVSAGGGMVGAELFTAALQAHRRNWESLALPMTLIAGPLFSEPQWQDLQTACNGVSGLTLLRSVPDLAGLLQSVTCSVSQCGYNTAMDIVAAEVPALVVPFSEGNKDEQYNRARRLADVGVVQILDPSRLTEQSLALAIEGLLSFQPKARAIAMDGAAVTARRLRDGVAVPAAGSHMSVTSKADSRTTHWLDPLVQCLEREPDHEVEIFIRDDDGGWDDARLLDLLDWFTVRGWPIDVAVIPMALTVLLAEELLARKRLHPRSLGLHQHGYQHRNHEVLGRKCEFGTSRSAEQQLDDIAAGLAYLGQRFDGQMDAIFTPPWNRCTQTTVDAMRRCGFRAISRNRSAAQLDTSGLLDLSITIDWQRQRIDKSELGFELARAIAATQGPANTGPVGIMLHHAVITAEELVLLDECLSLLQRYPQVQFRLLGELLQQPAQDSSTLPCCAEGRPAVPNQGHPLITTWQSRNRKCAMLTH
jgi:predicted glycosyltransferase